MDICVFHVLFLIFQDNHESIRLLPPPLRRHNYQNLPFSRTPATSQSKKRLKTMTSGKCRCACSTISSGYIAGIYLAEERLDAYITQILFHANEMGAHAGLEVGNHVPCLGGRMRKCGGLSVILRRAFGTCGFRRIGYKSPTSGPGGKGRWIRRW